MQKDKAMIEELKPCPFCGGAARIESNRDWHRLWADHSEDCIFDADEADLMYPATPKHLAELVEDWNRRAAIPSPAAPEEQAEIGQKLRNEYTSGTVTSDFGGPKITLRYITQAAAESAFVALTDVLDVAAVPRQAAVGEAMVDDTLVQIEAEFSADVQRSARVEAAVPVPRVSGGTKEEKAEFNAKMDAIFGWGAPLVPADTCATCSGINGHHDERCTDLSAPTLKRADGET